VIPSASGVQVLFQAQQPEIVKSQLLLLADSRISSKQIMGISQIIVHQLVGITGTRFYGPIPFAGAQNVHLVDGVRILSTVATVIYP